ncbi:hypothetical protein NESM_000183200 [Novymonas esmeraldas]|uniref:Uncharacterized protein n=1 Tax=Novymonas esmeraldas TaxID=1808958 RepID=A0AAW0F6E8_9TRYP
MRRLVSVVSASLVQRGRCAVLPLRCFSLACQAEASQRLGTGAPAAVAPSVYMLLERRLPATTLRPNEALSTLLSLVPANAHHLGVVQHLVDAVRGNACCLDAELCLAVMEQLLTPSLPLWLRKVDCDGDGDGGGASSAPMSDAALLTVLAPLGSTLSRCVAVRLHMRLTELRRSAEAPDEGLPLQHPHTCAPPSRSGDDEDDDSGGGTTFLLRGAAVLTAFTAPRQQQWWSGDGAASWHSAYLDAVVYPVVQYCTEPCRRAGELRPCGATAVGRAASSASATSPWAVVRLLGRRCWWWSVLITRALPVVPSDAVRERATSALVDAVLELHRSLDPHTAPVVSPGHPAPILTVWPCLAMLERLLVRGTPVLCSESSSDVPSPGPAWTEELRRGWGHLGDAFARLATAALQGSAYLSVDTHASAESALCAEARRNLVHAMVSVGYRLALQCVAAAEALWATTRATVTAVQTGSHDRRAVGALQQPRLLASGELDVAMRLLSCVVRVRPVLMRGTRGTGVTDASKAADVALIEERTWCKLACLMQLARCAADGDEYRSEHCVQGATCGDAGAARDDSTRRRQLDEAWLLRCGFAHALACTGEPLSNVARAAPPGATVRVAGATPCGADSSLSPLRLSPAFVCVLVRCWATWPTQWPASLHAEWLRRLPAVATAECDDGLSSAGPSPLTLNGVPDTRHWRQCVRTQSRLSAVLEEAWRVTAVDRPQELDSLEMCACWHGFSAAAAAASMPSLPTSTPTAEPCHQLHRRCCCCCGGGGVNVLQAQLAEMAAVAEGRLAASCEAWLAQHRVSHADGVRSTSVPSVEPRPMLRESLWSLQQRRRPLSCVWCPTHLPALISHAARRVVHCAEWHDVASPLAPMNDTFLSALRQATLTPASAEVTAFQLSIIARYGEWCEAAGVHAGWCACAVGAGGSARRTGMPWWVLTVDGLAATGGAHDGADAATLLAVWERGIARAAAEPPASTAPAHQPACTPATVAPRCCVRVLSPWRRGGSSAFGALTRTPSRQQRVSSDAVLPARATAMEDDLTSTLRPCVVEWGHRYALRLALLRVVEEQWQQHAPSEAALQMADQLDGTPPLRHRWRHRTGARARAPSAAADSGAHLDVGRRSSARTRGTVRRCEFHSDGYRPYLQRMVQSATRAADKLASDVLAAVAAALATLDAADTGSRGPAGQPQARAVYPAFPALAHHLGTASDPSRWTARVAAHLWSEVHDGLAGVGCRHRSTGRPEQQQQQQHADGLPGRVERVERLLRSLGLAAASSSSSAHGKSPLSCQALTSRDCVGDSYALLSSVLRLPELVCASPLVRQYADDVLWCRCWGSLVSESDHVAVACSSDRGSALEPLLGSEDLAAHLDLLATFRVVLACVREVHRLVEETADYLCAVYVPAAKANPPLAVLVTTPTEALTRLDTECGGCDGAAAHPAAARPHFSSSVLRAFEVLRLGCCSEERRRPRVWQRWTRELACGDARLREHPLLRMA